MKINGIEYSVEQGVNELRKTGITLAGPDTVPSNIAYQNPLATMPPEPPPEPPRVKPVNYKTTPVSNETTAAPPEEKKRGWKTAIGFGVGALVLLGLSSQKPVAKKAAPVRGKTATKKSAPRKKAAKRKTR